MGARVRGDVAAEVAGGFGPGGGAGLERGVLGGAGGEGLRGGQGEE